jgi:hypothetical protein
MALYYNNSAVGNLYQGSNLLGSIYDSSIKVNPGSDLDTDAANYLNQVVSVGGTVNTPTKIAVNNLFIALKATSSLYSSIKLMYPIVGGTAASHFIEAKAPTDSTKLIVWTGSAATHNNYGITVSQSLNGYGYIDKNWSSIYANMDSIGIGAYQRTVTAVSFAALIGKQVQASGSQDFIRLLAPNTDAGSNQVWIGNDYNASFTDTNPVGFMFGRRYPEGPSSTEIYLNGVSKATSTGVNFGLVPAVKIQLFGENGFGSQPTTNTNFFVFSDSIGDTEVSNLNTIISNFETALNRNY